MFEFFVGGYAQPDQPCVRRFTLDARTGRIVLVEAFTGLENPSWLLCHPHKAILYAVEELNPGGRITVLRMEKLAIRKVCSLPSGGADPCHLALDPDGKHLFCANYSSGSLSVFVLDTEGIPVSMSDFRQHALPSRESGTNPLRQEAPHVHFSLCDGERVFVNDLGMNRTVIYRWDAAVGRLGEVEAELAFPAGSGPRHLALSEDGRCLYVLCELTGRVHAFTRDADSWREIQSVSALPEDFDAFEDFNYAVGAAVCVTDNHLYVSCRGSHSIASFDIGVDGTLSKQSIVASGGLTPRDIQVRGNWLIAANQDSNAIVLFRRDPNGGLMSFGSPVEAVKPSCVCAVPVQQCGANPKQSITWRL